MNLDDLLSNGALLDELARSAGVGQGEARSGLEALLPAVTRGLERNAGSASGLESLIGALGSGGHERVLSSPELLGKPDTRADGNGILGHIFGSKDVSRNVAAAASEQTGLDSSVLKQLLPLVASVAMGALSQQTKGGESLAAGAGSSGGDLLGSLLGGLLGGGGAKEGGRAGESPMDDILDLAKKFL